MNVATCTGRRLDRRAILALILVPLLVAGGILAGIWRFDESLHTVRAAVVNNDEMVTINGQQVPLGRQLSAALIDSSREQNFTWVLADTTNASEGLASGRFAAVVTIPENFSAAATSYSGNADAAHQATISIETSPVAGIAETALGQSVADAAAQSLNNTLTEMYLDNIYIGFNTMGEQMVSVGEGARQLADGSAQLSDGLDQASDGVGQLASGLGQAAEGGRQLADNGPALASGARQLSDGLGTMAAQTAEMPAQIATMSDGATELATGMQTYATGVDSYVDGINSIVEPVLGVVEQLPDLTAVADGIDTLMADLPDRVIALDEQIQVLAGQLASHSTAVDRVASGSTTVECPTALHDLEGACDAFAQGVQAGGAAAQDSLPNLDAAQMTNASTWLRDNVTSIQQQWQALREQIPAGTSPNEYLVTQLTALRDGGVQLKDGGHQLADGTTQLADGIEQLSAGVPALVDGIQQVSDGASQLSSGVDQYTAGVAQLADGVSQAHDGTVTLSSGLSDAAAGSHRLTDGTAQLADGIVEGAEQIPSYPQTERANLAKVVASPISTTGLDALVTPNSAAVSLLLVLALWLGTLATYTLIRPVDPRNATSSSTAAHLVLRSLLPGVGVAAAQTAVLTALGSAFLSLGPAPTAALFALLLLAGLAFTTVNHALAAWGGSWGRLVSGAMLLVTTVTALTYTAPGIFEALRPLSPVSPALDAVRAVISSHSVALMAVTLVGWTAVGLLAGAARIIRSCTVSVKELADTDSSDEFPGR